MTDEEKRSLRYAMLHGAGLMGLVGLRDQIIADKAGPSVFLSNKALLGGGLGAAIGGGATYGLGKWLGPKDGRGLTAATLLGSLVGAGVGHSIGAGSAANDIK